MRFLWSSRYSWSLTCLSTSDLVLDLASVDLLSNTLWHLLGQLTIGLDEGPFQLVCRLPINGWLLLAEGKVAAKLWHTVCPWDLIGLFLVFGLLIELIDVNYIFLYEILFSLICASRACVDGLTNCRFLIDDFRVLWKSDLSLTVIFLLAASSGTAIRGAFLNFCGAGQFRPYLRTLRDRAVLCIWARAFVEQFAFFSLISLVINTDSNRARVSLEPALIGHRFASNKWLVLAQEASVTLLLVLRLHWFSLSNHSRTLAVDVYGLEFVGLARHYYLWTAWFMPQVFTLLMEWTQRIFSPLLPFAAFEHLQASFLLSLRCNLLDCDWLQIEAVTWWILGGRSLPEKPFRNTGAPSGSCAEQFEFLHIFRGLLKDLNRTIGSSKRAPEFFEWFCCLQYHRFGLSVLSFDVLVVLDLVSAPCNHFGWFKLQRLQRQILIRFVVSNLAWFDLLRKRNCLPFILAERWEISPTTLLVVSWAILLM